MDHKIKKIYLLPNLFTTANMFCGLYAIIASIHQNFVTAAWAIIVAIVFDMMDGRVARLTRATSAFGVEYDSFSDLISFGVAPGILAYLWCLQPFGRLGWLATFLYICCTALRLARFNISVNVISKKYFQGLPSPQSAGTIATAVIFYQEFELQIPKDYYMLALIFVLASLMISSIRFYSFKDIHVKRENYFGILAIGVLTLVLIAVKPELTLFGMALIYLIINLTLEVYRHVFQKKDKITVPLKI